VPGNWIADQAARDESNRSAIGARVTLAPAIAR
jgi:hypothetical protein